MLFPALWRKPLSLLDFPNGRGGNGGRFLDFFLFSSHTVVSLARHIQAKECVTVENKKNFGTFICQRRKELGMTQKEFAQLLFVTDSAVSKWERGVSHS